jgi:tetratricopeptide (TPR) repeat protein
VIGAALVLAVCFARLRGWLPAKWRPLAVIVVFAFFAFQAVRARQHAFDYNSDLDFWQATRRAAPNSAKAHLNYSVMVGARSRLEERLQISRRALELAPRWPMAHVYLADTLCRLKKVNEAWPHYKRGFTLAPNDPNLIALGLQCLWDEKAISSRRDELLALADAHHGSWLAYLASDIVHHGAKHGGVEKKYRPRGYDEGPKADP